eukprot:scaffold13554_cov19-Tisochrysis_lutea.AAC.1
MQNVMLDVEADCYWCLCKLISGVQDQYTYAQPGIQRAVFKIHELIGAHGVRNGAYTLQKQAMQPRHQRVAPQKPDTAAIAS